MVSAISVASPFTVAQILQWLVEVPDPEIPVLSVVDLGLIRDVSFVDGTCVVAITPTYSGCPAMLAIAADIERVLSEHGVADVRIETRLSPAWTTDWMTEKGRAALKAYGIAPPAQNSASLCGIKRRPSVLVVACPHCGSDNTRVVSHFGSTACKALYRCVACGEPFDYFKTH